MSGFHRLRNLEGFGATAEESTKSVAYPNSNLAVGRGVWELGIN